MATNYQHYIGQIRSALHSAMCLQSCPCMLVERQEKPEVDFQTSKELLLKPVLISRNESEKCLIEGSINSVRVSFKIKQNDRTEEMLGSMFIRLMQQRADTFEIMRRVPLDGWDVSFMITNHHLQQRSKQQILDFLCQFVEQMAAEINELKLALNARSRTLAAEWLTNMV